MLRRVMSIQPKPGWPLMLLLVSTPDAVANAAPIRWASGIRVVSRRPTRSKSSRLACASPIASKGYALTGVASACLLAHRRATRRAGRARLRRSGGRRLHVGQVQAVELLGRRFVAGHLGVDVGVGERHHAHVLEGLADLDPPQADVPDDGDDAGEEVHPELAEQLALVHPLGGIGREVQPLPHLLGHEAVPHPVARVHAELLALGALGFGELRVVVPQGQAPEHHVVRLVLHHVRVDGAGQGLRGHVADEAERGQCQSLDEDLHPEVGDVPAAVTDRVLQEAGQVAVDRVDQPDLLVEVPAVHLDVAGLVDRLGGGVELRVDVRHRLHDLGDRDERPLLAVHELAEPPRLELPVGQVLLLSVELVPPGRTEEGVRLVRHPDRAVGVHLLVPVQPVRPDPLPAGALVVQPQQLLPALGVVEVEHGPAGGVHAPRLGRTLHRRLDRSPARCGERAFVFSHWPCPSPLVRASASPQRSVTPCHSFPRWVHSVKWPSPTPRIPRRLAGSGGWPPGERSWTRWSSCSAAAPIRTCGWRTSWPRRDSPAPPSTGISRTWSPSFWRGSRSCTPSWRWPPTASSPSTSIPLPACSRRTPAWPRCGCGTGACSGGSSTPPRPAAASSRPGTIWSSPSSPRSSNASTTWPVRGGRRSSIGRRRRVPWCG